MRYAWPVQMFNLGAACLFAFGALLPPTLPPAVVSAPYALTAREMARREARNRMARASRKRNRK